MRFRHAIGIVANGSGCVHLRGARNVQICDTGRLTSLDLYAQRPVLGLSSLSLHNGGLFVGVSFQSTTTLDLDTPCYLGHCEHCKKANDCLHE